MFPAPGIVIRPDRTRASGDLASRRASAGTSALNAETDKHRPAGRRPATTQTRRSDSDEHSDRDLRERPGLDHAGPPGGPHGDPRHAWDRRQRRGRLTPPTHRTAPAGTSPGPGPPHEATDRSRLRDQLPRKVEAFRVRFPTTER